LVRRKVLASVDACKRARARRFARREAREAALGARRTFQQARAREGA
jgi:hypothetical protein